ncbi:hypothetical protein GW17_00053397 [Ensete ventricosum]|nr:hypothetical protein GW17_00053397 [Ensete ventricosum]
MKKFFDYIQLPNFDIASDASATFKGGPRIGKPSDRYIPPVPGGIGRYKKPWLDKEIEIVGNIWLRAIHGFRKQNRPFLIGTLQETGIIDEHQWKHPDNKPAGEATWAEPGETPYYATWPVQAYC